MSRNDVMSKVCFISQYIGVNVNVQDYSLTSIKVLYKNMGNIKETYTYSSNLK